MLPLWDDGAGRLDTPLWLPGSPHSPPTPGPQAMCGNKPRYGADDSHVKVQHQTPRRRPI